MIIKTEPGQDYTSKSTTPDYDSAKGYYWMKQIREKELHGSPVEGNWPRKQPSNFAEASFYDQVHRRLSRTSAVVNISFDENGKRIA